MPPSNATHLCFYSDVQMLDSSNACMAPETYCVRMGIHSSWNNCNRGIQW